MNAKCHQYILKTLIFGMLFTCLVSCDDDDAQPLPTISDFEGTWKAVELTMTNNEDSSQEFDFLENGGEARFTVLSNGGVRTWVTIDTFYDEWDGEIIIVDHNTVRNDPVENIRETQEMTYEFEGEKLRLINKNDVFDFTFSGAEGTSTTSDGLYERQ